MHGQQNKIVDRHLLPSSFTVSLSPIKQALCAIIDDSFHTFRETAVAQWLRYCATNWKIAGSIPDCVIEIFY